MVSDAVAISIGSSIGAELRSRPAARVHGGSINECYRWESDVGPLFVKVAPARNIDMLMAEAAGLDELRRARAVRVPRVLGVGASGIRAEQVSARPGADRDPSANAFGNRSARAWLALEWIESTAPSRTTDYLLGEQLAQQHRVTQPTFGWTRENTIGSTPQLNAECGDWLRFYRDLPRVFPQLSANAGTAPRRLVERQPARGRAESTGHIRPRGVLWGSRSRHRDDAAFWRLRSRILRSLHGRLGAGSRRLHPDRSI